MTLTKGKSTRQRKKTWELSAYRHCDTCGKLIEHLVGEVVDGLREYGRRCLGCGWVRIKIEEELKENEK